MSPAACWNRGVTILALAMGIAMPACSSSPSPASKPEPAPSAGPRATPEAPPSPGGEAQPSADDLRIAAIERAVNDTRATRHECWAYAAADNFRVEGRVVLGMTFGAGDTAAIDVVSDQPGDQRLTTCLTELYGKYRWPAGVFEAGIRIELPFSFTSPRYQYTVKADYVEPVEILGGRVSAKVLLDEQSSGNGAIALSLLTITGDLEMPLHRHLRAAEVLYVLSGKGRIYSLDGARRGASVGPGEAVYIAPGTAHGLIHKGKEPLVVVQLFTPSGPQKRYRLSPPVDTVMLTKDEIRRRPRRFPKPIVSRTPTVYPIAGGKGEVAFHFEPAITGDQSAYLGVMSTSEAIAIPMHTHPNATEVVLILEGNNTMIVDGDPYPVGPMTAAQIPAGIEHGVKGAGGSPLRAIQLYSPAGPEQRFKKAGPK